MRLPTISYAEQSKAWPQSGNHILAHYDHDTIIVYQAYSPAIAEFALHHGYFGDGFSYRRMSWVKPNFLWMMYRSNWGTSTGQERILGIRLKKSAFDSILDRAVASSFDKSTFGTRQEWETAVASSDIRLQWDPDHLPTSEKCVRRAIQIGLRGDALYDYGQRQVIEIIDLTDFVAVQRRHAANWQDGTLSTPVEQEYRPASIETAKRIGLELI